MPALLIHCLPGHHVEIVGIHAHDVAHLTDEIRQQIARPVAKTAQVLHLDAVDPNRAHLSGVVAHGDLERRAWMVGELDRLVQGHRWPPGHGATQRNTLANLGGEGPATPRPPCRQDEHAAPGSPQREHGDVAEEHDEEEDDERLDV